MLKHLELAGFKSFAKKTILDFTDPVTSIVGPNGSGKSNVVEAFRFVLGEQSIKSMRGRAGSDLIFKGSKHIPKQQRAYVAITFDNSKKLFKLSGDNQNSINLDFDEVTLSREVFSDGGNKYKINGSEVRLRDVVEVLASVHVGSSGHHIISQGQADRILNANQRERREMIEDALGLKVYQYRLRDSEKKLDKTELNIKEVKSLRKEIAPHLKFLKKQVEKIQQAQGMREDLSDLYEVFLKQEQFYIEKHGGDMKEQKDSIERGIAVLEKQKKAISVQEESSELDTYKKQVSGLDEDLRALEKTKQSLTHKLGRTEGMIEFQERIGIKESKKESGSINISRGDLSSFANELMVFIDTAIGKKDMVSATPLLERVRSHVSSFVSRFDSKEEKTPDSEVDTEELEDLQKMRDHIRNEIDRSSKEEDALRDKISQFEKVMKEYSQERSQDEKKKFDIEMSRRDLLNKKQILELSIGEVSRLKVRFEDELREGQVLVGVDIKKFSEYNLNEEEETFASDRDSQERSRRDIERIKIKLEESGILGGVTEVMKEFEETTDRDTFLLKELEDLELSMSQVVELIHDLKLRLDTEFKDGIEKINKQFKEFFNLMFGGGNAFLSLIAQKPRRRKGEDGEFLDDDETERVEHGVDINVSLPKKKVKDLNMLSGGERSLTSIALLFAMSQVNPPPFMVLDETDAALDEANSRRYGDMIANLARYAQLVVVTHNRETMSRAQVLYGVTLGMDESSKILSIKLGDAEQYAK
ncbi:MAG: chromosome segregation protein [Candidatus Paceibacteria bacterium]|jgi:chromosome segregation protein